MGWEQMFDPSGSYFLPDALRGALDPLPYVGPSPTVGVDAPEDVADSACASTEYAFNPIASTMPTLQVMDARIRGLSALHSGEADLTFSDKDPELTATVYSGKLRGADAPLTIESDGKPNYGFAVGCCVPVSLDSRQCSGKRWTATAKGKFTATIRKAKIRMTLRADFPASGEAPTLTVKSVKIDVDQSDIKVDFDISGLDKDYAEIASFAVENGIADNAVQTALQSYFDSVDFKKNLGQILTAELKRASEQT
jgi:hypothetical protein